MWVFLCVIHVRSVSSVLCYLLYLMIMIKILRSTCFMYSNAWWCNRSACLSTLNGVVGVWRHAALGLSMRTAKTHSLCTVRASFAISPFRTDRLPKQFDTNNALDTIRKSYCASFENVSLWNNAAACLVFTAHMPLCTCMYVLRDSDNLMLCVLSMTGQTYTVTDFN